LELLLEIGIDAVLVRGDSQVAINQSTEDFNCASDMLYPYLLRCRELMAKFNYIQFQRVQRHDNAKANRLAQMASGYIEQEAGVPLEVLQLEMNDWRVLTLLIDEYFISFYNYFH